jgi:hypothetical protein
MMRKFITLSIIVFLFLGINTVSATHFFGYDMELINIKDANNNPTTNYKWRLRFYRDISGVVIPPSFNFTIHRVSDHGTVGNFTVTKVNPQTIVSYPANLCAPMQSQNSMELGIYESAIQNYGGFNSANGYYVSNEHCCRHVNILNLPGSSDNYKGLMSMNFPRVNPGAVTQYNSSPAFKSIPQYGFSVGKQYTLDWSANDPDGDSLVYSMVLPREGGPTVPQFVNIQYASGYSINGNIADGDPDFRVHPSTGIILYKPTIAGRYSVAVRVEEFRNINGVPTKIGEVRRELMIHNFISQEAPPMLVDSLRNTKELDTVNSNVAQSIELNFPSTDAQTDSVFIKIIPDPSKNIFQLSALDAKWGDSLQMLSGNAAEGFVVKGLGSALAKLKLFVDSNSVSANPYLFKIVSYDNSCFLPLTDTLNYSLLISGNKCYYSTSTVYTACDSLMHPNGITYYQSTSFRDTIKNDIGCDSIYHSIINITSSPNASFVDLNIYVTDTAKIYSYKVDTHSNATYQWYTTAYGTIISGANSNEIAVKWNTDTTMEAIYCFVNRGTCFDSLSSPIVVSHIVGFQKLKRTVVKVYPNPVRDILNFETDQNLENANIKIYNTLGQMVHDELLKGNEVDVLELLEGVYHFVLSKDDLQVRGTFVKQ